MLPDNVYREASRVLRVFAARACAWKAAGNIPAAASRMLALPLQQIHLGIVWRRLGKTDAQADEAHRFSGAGKCFG